MAEYDLVILNALLVTDTETKACDIAVKNEKIDSVTSKGSLKDAKANKLIDAEGGYVMVNYPLSVGSYRLLDQLLNYLFSQNGNQPFSFLQILSWCLILSPEYMRLKSIRIIQSRR